MWIGIIFVRLGSVPETLWIARDDAVITLSHARNAADFGSIGVSPGDRTEGFSSPLHFVVAYLPDLVADPGYRALSIWIIVGASAITGAAVATMLRSLALEVGLREAWVSEAAAVVLTAVTAGWVVSSWTTVGWIGSGMENPVVIAAGMTALSIAISSSGSRMSQAGLVLALAAFAVGRVEFAGFVVPLVVAASWAHADRAAGPASKATEKQLLTTVGATLGIVALVHVGRRLYFGAWLPNTAVVQGRAEGGNRLLVVALLSAAVLSAAASIALYSGRLRPASRPGIRRGLLVMGLGLAALVLGMSLLGQTAGDVLAFLWLPPLPPLVLGVLALVGVGVTLNQQLMPLDAVFLAAASIPIAQFVALGQARLDADRVTSIAVPFLALWASSLILRLVVRIAQYAERPSWLQGRRGWALVASVAGMLVVSWTASATFDETRQLNWEVSAAQEIIDTVDEYRSEHLGEGLAILANPDLGKVSYEKTAVIVDLGQLGDPLLTRLAASRSDLVMSYLQSVAGPDVVELHGAWSCRYDTWLKSDVFTDTYMPADPSVLVGLEVAEDDCAFGRKRIIWLRTGPESSAEYALVRELLVAADPVLVVRREVGACVAARTDALRCQGVRRALQRASVKLRENGTYEASVAEMQASPSAQFDVPMLLRGPGWAEEAHDALLVLMGT